MDDYSDMDPWIRATPEMPMGPLTGDRPDDDIFTGAISERMSEAIVFDTINLMQDLTAKGDPDSTRSLNDLLHEAAILGSLYAARRIALEFKGCRIDPDHDSPYLPENQG